MISNFYKKTVWKLWTILFQSSNFTCALLIAYPKERPVGHGDVRKSKNVSPYIIFGGQDSVWVRGIYLSFYLLILRVLHIRRFPPRLFCYCFSVYFEPGGIIYQMGGLILNGYLINFHKDHIFTYLIHYILILKF